MYPSFGSDSTHLQRYWHSVKTLSPPSGPRAILTGYLRRQCGYISLRCRRVREHPNAPKQPILPSTTLLPRNILFSISMTYRVNSPPPPSLLSSVRRRLYKDFSPRRRPSAFFRPFLAYSPSQISLLPSVRVRFFFSPPLLTPSHLICELQDSRCPAPTIFSFSSLYSPPSWASPPPIPLEFFFLSVFFISSFFLPLFR